MSKNNSLNSALRVLKETYNAIDIRAVLARPRSDSPWQCIVLKIRLTNEGTAAIKKHQDKGEICRVSNDHLRIVFESKRINEIETLLKEIERGEISVKGTSARLIGYGHGNIRDREIINDPGYSTPKESNGYRNKAVYTSMNESPPAAIENLGIGKDEMGTTIEEIRYCLDMPALVNPTNVVVLLPIYFRRLQLLSKEKGKYLTRFQVHRSLVNRLRSKVRVYPEGRIGENPHIEIVDLEKLPSNRRQMVITRLPMKSTIQEGDHIEVDIFDPVIRSVTINEKFWASEVLPKKIYSFWLKNVIERIDRDLKILECWLRGENVEGKSQDFETAVSILLSLCGLRSVHVGDIYETKTIQSRRNSHKKSSIGTDIIALLPSEEDKTIFLCQCTTEWKKDEKFDDMLNFAHEFRRVSKDIDIKSVLITRLERDTISEYEATAKRRGVRVLTIDDLMALLNDIRQNIKPYRHIKSFLL
jgi:hypothetical protein